MQRSLLRVCLLGIFFSLPTGEHAQARGAEVGIRVLQTVDYPGSGLTLLYGINNRGDAVGVFLNESGLRGFVRSRTGQFFGPIADPNDTAGYTLAEGINNSRRSCGFYQAGSNYHGFLLNGNTYSTYDVPGAVNTFLIGENDAGYLVGGYTDSSGAEYAFFEAGGFVSSISVNSSTINEAKGVNASNEIVGVYYDAGTARNHGFFRDANGNLTFPLDPPGSISTIAYGINNNGIIVGRYVDAGGKQHGFVLQLPDIYTSFDFPGATLTYINGINDSNIISGRYNDATGLSHGFLAQIR